MKKILLLLALVAQPAFAHETMLGVSAGPSILLNPEDGVDKRGYHLEIKGLRNLDYQNSVIDLGGGLFYSSIKGDVGSQQINVKTYGGFLEGDYKFKLSQNLSIGPSVKLLMGPDVSFDATDDDSNSINGLIGAKGQLDLDLEGRMNSKVDLGLYSSVMSPNNLILLVGINFSLRDEPKYKPTPLPEKKAEVPGPVVLNVEPPMRITAPAPVVTPEEPLMVTIKSARVLFNTAAYEIDNDLKRKLQTLGRYLATNPTLYSRIKISGHTDNQGTREMNMDLSYKRAMAIQTELIRAGVPVERIESVGMGFSRPRYSNENAAGREKNRRTEVEFFGVVEREEFNQKMQEILK